MNSLEQAIQGPEGRAFQEGEHAWYVPRRARSMYIFKYILGHVSPGDFRNLALVYLGLSRIKSPFHSWSCFTIFAHCGMQFVGISFGIFAFIFWKLCFYMKIITSLNELGSVAYFTIPWKVL